MHSHERVAVVVVGAVGWMGGGRSGSLSGRGRAHLSRPGNARIRQRRSVPREGGAGVEGGVKS